MLTTPTIEKLKNLKLHSMASALDRQQTEAFEALTFEERLGLLADQEITYRENLRLQTRLRQAKLRGASFEDIDFRKSRGLDKSLLASLASGKWIKEHLNLLITGPCGVGKSFIAAAFGHKACLLGFKVFYFRIPRLFEELALAHGDGTFSRRLTRIQKADLLILDDWGLQTFSDPQRRDILEILEDRYNRKSTLVTSQLPIELWHEVIGNPTLADAILDRLVHNAYKINLKGDSMRKLKANPLKQSPLTSTQIQCK